jgi:hypothetical protein
MRTITYNEKAAPWSRSYHLMGTRLFPSSDGSDINLSGTLGRTKTEIMVNQVTLCLRLFNYAYLSPPPQFFLYLNLKLCQYPKIS